MHKNILISILAILIFAFTTFLVSCDGTSRLEVNNLIIEPANAIAGETVTISVEVTNTGNTEDTRKVTLRVNGVEESTEVISVASDVTQKVTFYLTRDIPGVYEIEVAGLNGEMAVVDLNEVLEKTAQAMSTIDSYHFNCTIEMELLIPDESLFSFEELP